MPRDLLAEIEPHQPRDLLADIEQAPSVTKTNPNWFGWRIPADVATGMAQGGQALRNAPYNITHAFAPETAERLASGTIGRRLFAPDTRDINSAFGVNNPNILDKIIQGASSYGPLAAVTGGVSPLGLIRGGTIAGGLLDENPISGALIGGALGGAGAAIPTLGRAYKGFAQKMGSSNPLNWIKPGQIAEKLKYRASPMYKAEMRAPAEAIYNELEQAAAGKSLYGLNEQEMAKKELSRLYGMKKNTGGTETYLDIPPEELGLAQEGKLKGGLEKLHDLFITNPEYKNARLLEQDLGKKIGYLNGKEKAHTLTSEEGRILEATRKARNVLKTDIEGFLEKLGPGYAQEYKLANDIYRSNVIPARNAEELLKQHINKLTGRIESKSLSNALQKATTESALEETPLPYDILSLSEQLRNRQLAKNAALLTGGVGAGWKGYHILRHLIPGL